MRWAVRRRSSTELPSPAPPRIAARWSLKRDTGTTQVRREQSAQRAGTSLAALPTSPTGRQTLVTDYGYNQIGQTTDVVEHSTSGFPTEFGSSAAPLATRYGYRSDGQVDLVTFPDGDIFRYDYDAAGRQVGLRGTDDGVEAPLISDAQYHDPVTGTMAAWTNHITLGGQP